MIKKIETRNFDLKGLEVRAETGTDTTGKAAGYAAVFNSDSHDLGGFVEVIEPGAFKRSLAQAASGSLNIYALWAHDDSLPLGSTGGGKLSLSEDQRGLAFELDTSRFTPAQLDSLADNELRMSFGFMVRDQEWKELDDGTIIRTLKDVDLLEVSFVINPAYPDTSAAKRSLDNWREGRRATITITEGGVDIVGDVTIRENIKVTHSELSEAFATVGEATQVAVEELRAKVTALRKRALQASLKARGKL